MSSTSQWLLCACLCWSCTGNIDPAGPGGASPSDRDADGIPDASDPNPDLPEASSGSVRESLAPGTALANGVGPRSLERLSRKEYQYSVRDLLGLQVAAGEQLPNDGLGSSGFELPGLISEVEARALQASAETLAAEAVKDLPRLMGCDAAASEPSCVTSFLTSFVKRAYRRPLEPSELSRLQDFFASVRSAHDLAGSVQLLLGAVLQSPQFLYHWQQPFKPPSVADGVIKLSAFDVASRLSYLLWSSVPDDALLAAAERGDLASAEGIAAQFERLLDDPRAERSIADFHAQWLSIQGLQTAQKDQALYPEYSAELVDAMLEENRAFTTSIILKGDGSFSALLTSPSSHVNAGLAKLYGVSGVTGDELRLQPLDPTQRSGLLTQAAFLSAQASAIGSNPILRGKVVYERVACGVTVAPPPDVPPPAPPTPNLTTRERFAQHASNACAQACHEKFDPPGFAFENYDGIGRWRTTENNRPVDASGTLQLPMDGPVPFQNGVQLAALLAGSSDARQCIVRQWSRYALKRHEMSSELGSLQTTYAAFQNANFNIRELLRQLVTMKTFVNRMPAPGEVLQ